MNSPRSNDHLARRVVEDLEWVVAYWPDLAESRLPGTARPWRQPHLTREQREERAFQDAIERRERAGEALAEAPAPVSVSVLDTMSEILIEAEALAWELACAARGIPHTWPGLPASAFADARPYLEFAAAVLPGVETASPGDQWARYVAPAAAGMVNRVAQALVLVHDGQRLKIECPWCHGVTADTPEGGAWTWRIRQLPGGLVAIVCEGQCEPPSKDVGTWLHSQPVWPMSEWDWLAKRLQSSEQGPPRARRKHQVPTAGEELRGAPVDVRPDLLEGLVR